MSTFRKGLPRQVCVLGGSVEPATLIQPGAWCEVRRKHARWGRKLWGHSGEAPRVLQGLPRTPRGHQDRAAVLDLESRAGFDIPQLASHLPMEAPSKVALHNTSRDKALTSMLSTCCCRTGLMVGS